VARKAVGGGVSRPTLVPTPGRAEATI